MGTKAAVARVRWRAPGWRRCLGLMGTGRCLAGRPRHGVRSRVRRSLAGGSCPAIGHTGAPAAAGELIVPTHLAVASVSGSQLGRVRGLLAATRGLVGLTRQAGCPYGRGTLNSGTVIGRSGVRST